LKNLAEYLNIHHYALNWFFKIGIFSFVNGSKDYDILFLFVIYIISICNVEKLSG